MEPYNFQQLHGISQREDSESPQLQQQFTPTYSTQNIRLTHQQLQAWPSTEQAMHRGLYQSTSVHQYTSSAPLQTSDYGILNSERQIYQLQSPAGHNPAPTFQHEQHIHANTWARPVSEMPSQNIQQTYQSQGFREYAVTQNRFMSEPHQYPPQQMLMPQVQPSLLQGVDMTSHGQDQPAQPFSQQGSCMIGQSFQQSYLPSQHQLPLGQPLAQQETGRVHHGDIGTSSEFLHQGSGVMAEDVQPPHLTSPQQMLIQLPTYQTTDSVQQRQTFESPEHLQMPFQYSEQPVSYQQFQSSLEGETKKRKHQHRHDETNVSPDVSESGQTSMRNVRHKSGRAPQFEHSSHHEGVASSSTDTWEHRRNQQRHDEFLKLLLRIAGDLGTDELKSLKFLCRNGKSMKILKREIEHIHDARDLFEKLLDRNLISADDSSLLVDLLKQIHRVDLVQEISPIQSHNVTESITWLQKYLKEKYQRHYKAFKPIPWNTAVSLSLTEIYTRLKVMKADKGSWFKKGLVLENELDIFKNTDAELPCRRIAIQGAPAMGKSTFCRKLAYDWACGKLPQFQFLFFLEMRHVSDKKRLDDIIFHQLLPEDAKITKEVLYNYIQQNQNLVLCLFDGLDELASISGQKSDILAIISEKLLTWCTVVTTTRPNMLHSSLNNCHAHFTIEGFTQTDAVNFISKYFTHVGNQQEAEKLISELKLKNVKPLQSYPYKVDNENDSTEIDSGDSDDKSLQNVDDTTGSHIRYDLLCNPLHLTFVCLLWEERKIIPKSNMTNIYTDILDCVLKRYCCKNDKTLVNEKVPQDVNDEVNRLARYACDVCLKGNMLVDEDGLSETILNLGLLVKDSGISRVKVQRHCFFYHKTWLEYFTALHICNNVHDIVHSIGGKLVNQKQVCLFAAGILKKKADPFLKQLVKKMQCKYVPCTVYEYDTLANNITAEFSLICECLHEASIDIDYLAPDMPNQLILLGEENVRWYTYSILQHNDKNIYGLLNCDTVFVFEQLRNMLCQKKGSVTNIKHLLITNESHDEMSELARQVTKMFLSLTTFEIQEVSIAYMQLLTEALRKGWQLNTLILSPAMIDPELKEQASQTVIDLFKSVNCSKYLKHFSWDASAFIGKDLQDLILCPLNELVEDGPDNVTLFMYYLSSENNAIEIESLSDSLCKFTTKCKNTKKLIVHCYCFVQYTCALTVTKLIQALKSASQVLTSYGILCKKLFKTSDTTQNLVEALNMNSNISDFEARVSEDQVSNVIHFIGEVKHVKSLTLHTYFPDVFKSLITNIELKGVLKHLTIEVFFSQCYIRNKVFDDYCGGDEDQLELFWDNWNSDHDYVKGTMSNYLISPLNILLSKAKTSSLHSLTVTTLLEEEGEEGINVTYIENIASMLSSHVESKDIVMHQFVSHLAVDLKTPFEFSDKVNGVTITIDITSANDK